MANFYASYPAVSVASAPVQFLLDGAVTSVSEDTATPANSHPLPVVNLTPGGIPFSPINTAGDFAEITNLTTTAQTFTPPTNAVSCKLLFPSDQGALTTGIRFKVGGTATVSSGFLMEPGRSEDINVSAPISVIAVSGSGIYVCVQWILNS